MDEIAVSKDESRCPVCKKNGQASPLMEAKHEWSPFDKGSKYCANCKGVFPVKDEVNDKK